MRYSDLADPKSVHVRSLSCDLTWPTYSTISKEELDLPLAYVLTVFSDPRNIELTLATIFRPHNSYCLHVDPKSDHMFRYLFKFLYLMAIKIYNFDHIEQRSKRSWVGHYKSFFRCHFW